MNSLIFLKLTENDKRVIFILLAVIIFLLVIIAFIGYLVTRVMRWQGKQINHYVTDAVITGVITNEDDFKRYAKKKNLLVFYKQARIPALIFVIAIIFYIVASSATSFTNPFDHHTGFGTLLFIWDFSTIITKPESGMGLLLNWPQLINTPHVTGDAWISYIFVPLALVGGLWYLYTVQAYIARYLQIKKLSQKIFNEAIENFTANTNVPTQPVNNTNINE